MARAFFGLSLESAKRGFFDRSAVKKATDKATRRALSRAGFLVRKRAMSLIKPGKGTSPPGSPPKSHVGLLRKFILYSYEHATESVVIGPALLSRKKQWYNVPAVLEFGGTVRVGKRKLRYRARPYMNPALLAESKNLEKLWKNSVK